MAAVVFNYTTWAARYPELASAVDSALATIYFGEAQIYLDNTDGSVVANDPPSFIRATLFNMLVAHIAALNAPIGGQPSSPLVGRIAQAAEGTVNVQIEYDVTAPEKWFAQTKYGAAYWQATAAYRLSRYRAPRGYPYGPFRV